MPVTTEPKFHTVCLAEFKDDSSKHLHAIATPGQATLLAEQCDRDAKERVVREVALYFVQQASKQGKQVHIFAPHNHGGMADATHHAGCDNACIRHTILSKDITAIDLVEEAMKFTAKPELILFLLPPLLNQKEHAEAMQAASDLADAGAAVLYVLRMTPLKNAYRGEPAIFDTAGASVDGYFHRAWIVQDKASTINTSGCNLLCPLSDPQAEQGYSFTVEGQRPVFNLQYRTKNAQQSTSLALPQIVLAVPNA